MTNQTLLAQVTTIATEMRTLQREYFKNRSKSVMQASIVKEKELDALLAQIGVIKPLGNTTIRTASGKTVDILNFQLSDVDIFDIMTGLSNNCRFNGQVKVYYSVLEHSMWMARRAPMGKKLATLLHDAEEFIIPDMAGPQKQCFPDFKIVGKSIQRVIFRKFGLDEALCSDPVIKELDNMALEWEMYNVRDNNYHEEVERETAKARFMQMFQNYYNNKL